MKALEAGDRPRWPTVGSEAVLTGTIRDEDESSIRHTTLKPKTGIRVRVIEVVEAEYLGPKPRKKAR